MTRLRLNVPSDLAIVGYDDIDFAAAAAVPLTSVRQPRSQLGQAATKLLIEEAGVAVAPGVGFGEYGEGYVRVGLVENEHRIRQAARNVKKFLSQADEILARSHNVVAAQ